MRSLPAVDRKFTPFLEFEIVGASELPPPMTDEQIRAVLTDLSYKESWTVHSVPGGIRAWFDGPDIRDPERWTTIDGEFIGTFYTPEHVVDIVGQGIVDMENHEFREWFRYQGRCVYEPHPELAHA